MREERYRAESYRGILALLGIHRSRAGEAKNFATEVRMKSQSQAFDGHEAHRKVAIAFQGFSFLASATVVVATWTEPPAGIPVSDKAWATVFFVSYGLFTVAATLALVAAGRKN